MRRMEARFLLNLRIWGSRMVFRLKTGRMGLGEQMGCMKGRMGILFKGMGCKEFILGCN